jgi:pyruvate formate lyase activating enzyme
MKYVYIGNVPGLDAQNTVCPKCKQVVVERRGFTVVKNDLVKGCCSKCGEKIAGVWE